MTATQHLGAAIAAAQSDDIRHEITRADAAASMLLALAGGALAVVLSTGALTGEATPGRWLIRAGAVAFTSAVLLLLAAVRPKLRTAPFRLVANGLATCSEAPQERARNLARVATGKFLRIRLAVDALFCGVALIAAGYLLASITV